MWILFIGSFFLLLSLLQPMSPCLLSTLTDFFNNFHFCCKLHLIGMNIAMIEGIFNFYKSLPNTFNEACRVLLFFYLCSMAFSFLLSSLLLPFLFVLLFLFDQKVYKERETTRTARQIALTCWCQFFAPLNDERKEQKLYKKLYQITSDYSRLLFLITPFSYSVYHSGLF